MVDEFTTIMRVRQYASELLFAFAAWCTVDYKELHE